MAILEIRTDDIVSVEKTTMADENLRERGDLQRLLRVSIDAVAEDLMILAEEFGNWEDSRRRIDLLALDRKANLVVIELKRTQDGGHMELQALRYAAMVSPMTFEQAVEAHRAYMGTSGQEADTQAAILEFLEWEEPNDDLFGQDVRIILVSMDFSKEVTSTVLWLIKKGLDIRCVRLTPYKLNDRVLLDVQQIIPLPEAADFQTRVREKERIKSAQRGHPDLTRFTLTIAGKTYPDLSKSQAGLQLFKSLVALGVDPNEVASKLGGRNPERTIRRYEGQVDSERVTQDLEKHGPFPRHLLYPDRWFHSSDDLIRFDGDTYVVNNRWGRHTEKFLLLAAAAFPQYSIRLETSRSGE